MIIFRIGVENNSPAKLIRATSAQVYGHVYEIVNHKEMVTVAVNSSVGYLLASERPVSDHF